MVSMVQNKSGGNLWFIEANKDWFRFAKNSDYSRIVYSNDENPS